MRCFRDGDQFVVTREDFVNLQESPAVFVPVDSENGRILEKAGVYGLSLGSLRPILEELWGEVKPVLPALPQLAERLAQEHVVAGEAMAWVEFLREPLTAIIAASDAQEWEAWEKGMERARAALAECDPSKSGATQPQPLKEARAALAGMRQVLEAYLAWGPMTSSDCDLFARKFEKALAGDFGRDRLALERDMYRSLVALRRESCGFQYSSCLYRDDCRLRANCEQAGAVLAKCSEAGLP